MNARLEAAMKAVREDMDHPLHWAPRRIATRALTAADDVMFNEAAVMRVAEAIYQHIRGDDWADWADMNPLWKNDAIIEARAVIAALREDQP